MLLFLGLEGSTTVVLRWLSRILLLWEDSSELRGCLSLEVKAEDVAKIEAHLPIDGVNLAIFKPLQVLSPEYIDGKKCLGTGGSRHEQNLAGHSNP